MRDEARQLKDEEIRILYVLREKKGKSISGTIPGDKHLFKIENDVTSTLEDYKDQDIKLVKQLSHKTFTYFRNDNDIFLEANATLDPVYLK